MSTADNDKDDVLNICANCGKGEEGSVSLKGCTACKLVKYCNRDCQITHRPQHKKACKKRAAELHDEQLFKEVEPEDCPICMIRLPILESGSVYMSCCGKVLCKGCIYAPVYDDKGNRLADTCPFCRTPGPFSDEEMIEMNDKRIKLNDANAIYTRGCLYANGSEGFPQDMDKALELWHRAAELGFTSAYYGIGIAYKNGRGVEMDEKKAKHYWELAAMGGNVDARHFLGHMEVEAGNIERALRHYMIAVRGGFDGSVNFVRMLYSNGDATKDDYTKALLARQAYLDEIKSGQRDKAVVCSGSPYYDG